MRRWLGIALALLVALGGAPAAHAGEPVQVQWESLLPPAGSTTSVQPHPLRECRSLKIACIDQVARRLHAAAVHFGCDHRAVFATTYEMLTRALRRAYTRPHFFGDRRYLVAEDVLFARFYFRTMDAWSRGDVAAVPAAWRVALDAWRQGDTFASQDLLLGINAHVQRDMPFVVAALGLRKPDGQSRKPDHDLVNEVLNEAYEPIVEAVTRMYDPLTGVFNSPLTPADDYAGIEAVKAWREGVWRNAERLLAAKTQADRDQVAQQIELNAQATAEEIVAAHPVGYGPQRDAYCRSNLQPEK